MYIKSREVIRTASAALVVDGFRFTSQYLQLRYLDAAPSAVDTAGFRATFVLTHFHSDHYIGLHKSWAFGKILCSRGTGRLLHSQLGIPADRILGLEMDQLHVLDLLTGVPVASVVENDDGAAVASLRNSLEPHQVLLTLLSANHCPASVMLVLESNSIGTVMHTGDFRYNGKSSKPMLRPAQGFKAPNKRSSDLAGALSGGFSEKFIGDHPAICRVAGKIDVLFLDNTFCDRSFRFPPQTAIFHQVTKIVEDAFCSAYDIKHTCRSVTVTAGEALVHVKGENKTCSCYWTPAASPRRRCLHVAVLVGTYTIGKERVALAIRNRFGVPIHLSPEKADILESCDAAREFGCDASAFKRVATPDDISETVVSAALLPGLNERNDATRMLLFSEREDEEMDVQTFMTLFLVPLSTLSYPSLADGLGLTSGKGDAVEADEPSSRRSDLPCQEGVDASTPKLPSAPFIRLWGECSISAERFDAIVGIEPTGWAEGRSGSRILKKLGRRVTVHSVPYSEHCSFDEMLDFVALVKPAVVVPTVSQEMFTKNEPLFVERCPRLRSKYSNTQPLSRFQHLFRKKQQLSLEPLQTPPCNLHRDKSTNVDDGSSGPTTATLSAAKQRNPFATGSKRAREETPGSVLLSEKEKQPSASDHGSVTLLSDDDEVVVLPLRYVIDDDDD